VHGGIGAPVTSIGDLGQLSRPITTDRDDLLVRTLVWKDPVTQNIRYGQLTRSDVPMYGMIAVREFLRDNGLKLIIRAHQCVNGVQLATGFPAITVFIAIDASGRLEKIMFPPIERIPRETASFFSLGGGPENGDAAVLRQAAVIALRRPHRTLGQNSVAALLVPRRILPLSRTVHPAASFCGTMTFERGRLS
jgi:hypothetical protein